MRNDGSAFTAAMGMNERMEKAGGSFTKSMFELAKEIMSRPIDTHTEAEKNFIESFAIFSITSLISNKMGGAPDAKSF